MSKEKIEALYDVIVENKGPIMDTPGKELTKDEFVNGYIKATKKDREEIIEEFKNDVPKDTFGGFGANFGLNTNKSKQDSIDEAVVGANKEIVKSKFKISLKEAARKVIQENKKEDELSGKKTTFADLTIRAKSNQKEKEERFESYIKSGNFVTARKMLFDGEHPMTVTPTFVEAMEAKDPKSPILKLLYERQLKTELDRKLVQTSTTTDKIEELAKKLSPNYVFDAKIDGKPILTYVALNSPNAVDMVARINTTKEIQSQIRNAEGETTKTSLESELKSVEEKDKARKGEALIEVAERSGVKDYDTALILVSRGAEAKEDKIMNISKSASSVVANRIAKIVKISSSTHSDLVKLEKDQDFINIKKLKEQNKYFDNVRSVSHGVIKNTKKAGKNVAETYTAASKYMKEKKPMLNAAKATAKGVGAGIAAAAVGTAKYGTIAAKGVGAGIAAAAVGTASLAGAGYNAAAAGMKKHKPLKKTAMAIAATPAAIIAGTKLVTTQALSMAYYNAAAAKNSTVSGFKDAGAFVNGPKKLLAIYRKVTLGSKEKTVNNYMSNVLKQHFDDERKFLKSQIPKDIKDNKELYQQKKFEMDAAIHDMQAPLEQNLKEMKERHDLMTAELASGRHLDDKGMVITDKVAIQEQIKLKMQTMAEEKIGFLSQVGMVKDNLASIDRMNSAVTAFKKGKIKTTSQLSDALKDSGSNSKNVGDYLKKFDKLPEEDQLKAAMDGIEDRIKRQGKHQKEAQVLSTTCDSLNKKVVKNFESNFGHVQRVVKENALKEITQTSYNTQWDANYKSAKQTFKNVIKEEESFAKWVASLVPERKAKETSVEEQRVAPLVALVSDKGRGAMLNRGDRLETSSVSSEDHGYVGMIRRAVSEVSSSHESDEDEMSVISSSNDGNSVLPKSKTSFISKMKNTFTREPKTLELTTDNLKNRDANNPRKDSLDTIRSNSTEVPKFDDQASTSPSTNGQSDDFTILPAPNLSNPATSNGLPQVQPGLNRSKVPQDKGRSQ